MNNVITAKKKRFFMPEGKRNKDETMDMIISYIKNDRIKRVPNVEFVEFDMILKRFYYWEFGSNKGKSIGLKLVKDIKVNTPERKVSSIS